jgi:alkylation response protein AidB-like acyl-CoA dehydrogenase
MGDGIEVTSDRTARIDLPVRPSRETLLSRARVLATTLSERSAECEAQRRVPAATVADYIENGLMRLCQPQRYGGYELGWDLVCEIGHALARGCGSQAWIQHIFNGHVQFVCAFSLEAQDDVWSKEPDAQIAASFDPVGKARPVQGGMTYSGRHAFSSGIDHAQWLICGGRVSTSDGAAQKCFFLLPKSDVKVIDDWYSMGLAGTGSNSFEVADVFVPEHRILTWADFDAGSGPGGLVNRAPIYRLPATTMTVGFASCAVGVAAGFLDEYLSYTRPRKSRGVSVAASMGTQIGAGHASALIDAASAVCLDSARRSMQTAECGEQITAVDSLRSQRDAAFACKLALDAVTPLFTAAGGRVLTRGNALQRRFRDLLAITSHHALVWDSAVANYGRHLLGAE